MAFWKALQQDQPSFKVLLCSVGIKSFDATHYSTSHNNSALNLLVISTTRISLLVICHNSFIKLFPYTFLGLDLLSGLAWNSQSDVPILCGYVLNCKKNIWLIYFYFMLCTLHITKILASLLITFKVVSFQYVQMYFFCDIMYKYYLCCIGYYSQVCKIGRSGQVKLAVRLCSKNEKQKHSERQIHTVQIKSLLWPVTLNSTGG